MAFTMQMGPLAEDILRRVCAKSPEEEICWENYKWFNVDNFAERWEWQEIKLDMWIEGQILKCFHAIPLESLDFIP